MFNEVAETTPINDAIEETRIFFNKYKETMPENVSYNLKIAIRSLVIAQMWLMLEEVK